MPEINYQPDPIPDHGKDYGGGGFQGSPARKTVVSLSHAQILALPSTPIIIVPATETLGYVGNPVRVPLVEMAVLHWKAYNSVAYGNVGVGSYLSIFIGSDAGNGSAFIVNASTWFTSTSTTLGIAQMTFGLDQDDGSFSGRVFAQQVSILDSVEDNAVSLAGVNAGDFTGGHANDIIRLSLLYRIFNTATGEFE